MEKAFDNRKKPRSDREIGELADRQHGVVATWQLGLSAPAIHRRAASGRLHRKHRGVYAVGRSTLTREGHWMAAVLAYGPDAVISHRTAAAAWGIGTSTWKIHLTTPQSKQSRSNIRAHVARLHPEDVSRRDGLPATSVPRTILDLAANQSEDALSRVIENADRLGLFDLAALEQAIERRPRAAGIPRIRSILADYRGAADTRSSLERDFRALIARAALPEPQFNVLVAGVLVDAYWPQWRLAAELDSRTYHATPRAFENDRIRDASLQKAGCRVLRITDRRLNNQPAGVLADIIALANNA